MISTLLNVFAKPSAEQAARSRAAQREKQQAPSDVVWPSRRDPVRVQDTVLSPLARTWLGTLPPAARPQALCEAYPRIANRLALCWSDSDLAGRLLSDLIVDRRGTRRGFPPAIAAELIRLREHQPLAAGVDDGGSPWDRRALATVDR